MSCGVGLTCLLEQGVSFSTWWKSRSFDADLLGKRGEAFFERNGLFDMAML